MILKYLLFVAIECYLLYSAIQLLKATLNDTEPKGIVLRMRSPLFRAILDKHYSRFEKFTSGSLCIILFFWFLWFLLTKKLPI